MVFMDFSVIITFWGIANKWDERSSKSYASSTVKYRDPTDVVRTGTGNSSYGEDIMPNNKSNKVVYPLPEIQANVKMKLQRMIHLEEEKHPLPHLSVNDVDMETRIKFMETQDWDGVEWSTSNTGSDIILEPNINMDTSDLTRTQKRQWNQQ